MNLLDGSQLNSLCDVGKMLATDGMYHTVLCAQVCVQGIPLQHCLREENWKQPRGLW